MKIGFVARHGCGDNDDEGSVTEALRALGHTVYEVHERGALDWLRFRSGSLPLDWLLFLKWSQVPLVRGLPGPYRNLPLVGWFYDMVRSVEYDPTLIARDAHRQTWMNSVLPHCLVMFCTDGDYVAWDKTGKCVHLMQGADERVVGPGSWPDTPDTRPPLLFAGMVHHGRRRASHIAELKARYGDKLEILGNGGPHRRKHGRALADYVAGRIVIAPDGPQTDRYMSNRLVQACGFGAFILHPYCAVAASMYRDRHEVVFYQSRPELLALIDHYLTHPREQAARTGMACRAYERTLREHLYRHRAAELVTEVERRLR